MECKVRHSASNTKKKSRTKNFSTEEDLLLISAWLNIHQDNVVGTNQSNERYWERMLAYFNEQKNFPSERNANSLMHCWSTIQLDVGKFQAQYIQIENINQSGQREQNKVCEALELYKSLGKAVKGISLLSLLERVATCSKICEIEYKKKQKTIECGSPTSSSPGTPDVVGLNDGIDPATGLEQPKGRKQSKELFKEAKKKEKEVESEGMKALLVEMKEPHDALRKERLDKVDELLRMEKERLEKSDELLKMEKERHERERKKEERKEILHEERILSIDVTKLDVSLARYYSDLKVSILEKRGIR
ncbi:hypothetical protein M5689_019084 [Euphorbia peplus]|nr:hypothetical protein M5689_019084 [Euphorbia peplus]